MKEVYAITPHGEFSPERLPFALKSVWKKLLPYSIGGIFWCDSLKEAEITQLVQLGMDVKRQNAFIDKGLVFYNGFLKVPSLFIRKKYKFPGTGIGVIVGMTHVENKESLIHFINYLQEGIKLFNGELFAGGRHKKGYFLLGFIPSGNIYLLQEAFHSMKVALEVYGLGTKAILYLSRFIPLMYEGKVIRLFDRYSVDFLLPLWELDDLEIVTEKRLFKKYPSIRTGLLFKPQTIKLLDRDFHIIDGVTRRIDISKRIVNRKDELYKLQELTNNAIKKQDFTLIGITGPFGIGKTSLVLELLRRIINRERKINTYFIDFEKGTKAPLYGIKKIFEALSPPSDFNVPSGDPLYINARLGYIIMKELVTKGRIESEIPGSASLTLIKIGLGKYFEYMQTPSIIVLDDIEFMDEVSRSLLYEILNKISQFSIPVAIILIARKDNFFNGIDGMKEIIRLGPMEFTEPSIVHILLNNQVENALAKYIYQIANGHPFYIEQFTKYLKEEGIIERKDGVYHPVTPLPQKIDMKEVIKKRLKSLGEDISYILDIVTIQDTPLPLSFYSAILEKEESFFVSPGHRINDNAFVLQLVDDLNEIFYISQFAFFKKMRLDNILASTKRNLHKKIVEIIEEKFRDNLQIFYSTLVYHSRMAGLKEKELKYLKELYSQARRLNILTDCINYLERLMEIDPRHKHRYMRDLVEVYSERGEWDKATSILDHLIETTDNPALLALAYREKAHIATFKGNFQDAHKLIDMSMAVALKSRNFADVAGAYLTKGTIYWAEGKLKKALENYKKTLETVLMHNIKGRNCIVYGNIGLIMYELGNLDEAARWYFEALEHCKKEKDHGTLANLYGNIGGLYERTKNLKEAEKYVLYSLDISRQKGFLQYEARGHLQLAYIYMQEGKLNKAKKEAGIALSLFGEIGDVLGIYKTLLALGRIARKAGNTPQAIAYFVQAVDKAESLNNPSLKVDAYLELSKMHKGDKGIKYLGIAYHEAASSGLFDKLVHVAIELARKFKIQGKKQEAMRILQDAMARVQDPQKALLSEEIERLRR